MTVSEFYLLHNAHHRDIVTSALVVLGVALLVGVVGVFARHVDEHTSRRDLFGDFSMMLLIKFGLIGLFFAVADLVARFRGGPAGGESTGVFGLHFEPLASALPLPPLLALLLYIVVRDFGQWVKHFTLHKVPCLWAFHKIHHANTSLSMFSDYRLHIVEVCIGSTVTVATLVITGYPVEYAFIAISLEETVSMFNHSNLRIHYGRVLSRVVTSPQNHRIHHSREAEHLDASGDAHNFAILLPVWDLLFGTYFRDIENYPRHTGVAGEEELETGGLLRRQWIGFRDFFAELGRLFSGSVPERRADSLEGRP